MTNEEKAREIAAANANPIVTLENRHTIEVTIEGKIKKAALEMAEWKDEQFKEYLEKKKIEVDKKMGDAYENGDQWDYYIAEQNKQLFDEIINELFPKQDNSNNDE